MAENFEVKFQKELGQMEKFAKQNLKEASEALKRAEENRDDFKDQAECLEIELKSLSKHFLKVAKGIALMAINPPKLSKTVKGIIQPVLDYLECLERYYNVKRQYLAAKGEATEAKAKLETAQSNLDKVTAMQNKG